MSFISRNIEQIKKELPAGTTLVAVSKTKPVSDIQEAYEAGHRDFGENRVQEMCTKQEQLPGDIRWHMIGHVQRNKIKYMAPFVHLIHGVDSLKTLREIDKQAKKNKRIIDCLLQVHIAEESTKFGFSLQEVEDLVHSGELDFLEHTRIKGLMGMATFTDDSEQIRREFRSLKQLFDSLSQGSYTPYTSTILSMGMSGDYRIALEEGSNMIRIGSAIFGARDYVL
jgi:pyridoxal phosphate enzyme (YggS family)